MSKVNEYSDLENLINAIPYLDENDLASDIYNWVLYLHGEKTQSSILSSGLSYTDIATMINNKFIKVWTELKTLIDNNIDLSGYVDTEKTDNQIYGYNSTTGVNDYTTIKTITHAYPNIWEYYKNSLDFFGGNNYTCYIVSCIASVISLPIYEQEDF